MADNKTNKENPYKNVEKTLSFADRLPYRMKVANNGKWIEEKAKAYHDYYPDNFGDKYVKDVEDNYEILAGNPPKNYNNNPLKIRLNKEAELGMAKEGIPLMDTKLKFYDSVSPIVMTQVGDQQRRELRVTVTDSSHHTQNYIKTAMNEAVTNWAQEKFIQPANQMALQRILQEEGIQDPLALTPEQRAEIEQIAAQQAEALSPQDIVRMVKVGPQGIHERKGQELVNLAINQLDVKFITDQQYLESYATGGEFYFVGEEHNKPVFRPVDMVNFYTYGRKKKYFCDNNDLFKETIYMTPGEVLDLVSEEKLTQKELEKLDTILGRYIGSGGTPTSSYQNHLEAEGGRLMAAISTTDISRMQQMDLRTWEGQKDYYKLKAKYLTGQHSYKNKIRVVHVVFRSNRKVQYVLTRKPTGKLAWEVHSEHYRFNRANGDVKRYVRWAPEYWHCYIIEPGMEPLYIKKERLPYQQNDLNDPYDVSSCYTGGFYFRLNYESEGDVQTPIGKAKTLMHDINVAWKNIKEREATDIGKVLLMALEAKPDGWSWGKFLRVVRALKVVPVDLTRSKLTGSDLNFFKEIDLSNMYQIVHRLNYLQFLYQKLAESLFSNQAQRGVQPASTSVTNNIQNLDRAQAMTSNLMVWHDKILIRLLQRLVQLYQRSIKQGNGFLRYATSNQTIATIDIDPELVRDLNLGIQMSTEVSQTQLVDIAQNFLLPYANKRDVSAEKALDILLSKNIADMRFFAREMDIDADMRLQSEREFQMELEKNKEQYMRDMQELLFKHQEKLNIQDNMANIEIGDTRADVMKRGQDVNDNNVPDFEESKERDRRSKRQQALLEDRRKKYEIDKKSETDIEVAKIRSGGQNKQK